MKRHILCFALFFTFAFSAYGQVTGLPPFGSLDRIGAETRNNQDLNVLIGIPIMSSPGRGGSSLDFSLVYNSDIWCRSFVIELSHRGSAAQRCGIPMHVQLSRQSDSADDISCASDTGPTHHEKFYLRLVWKSHNFTGQLLPDKVMDLLDCHAIFFARFRDQRHFARANADHVRHLQRSYGPAAHCHGRQSAGNELLL